MADPTTSSTAQSAASAGYGTTASNTAALGLGLGDLLGLFGGSNPFAGISRSMNQFQRGVGQFLESVEKFNATMDELNGVAVRINGLLDTVEEPVKALVPQVNRTLRAADIMVEQLSGPVARLAPALAELTQRLAPLTQIAESAGGWLGLRPLAALRGGGGSARSLAEATTPTPSHPPKALPSATDTADGVGAPHDSATKKAPRPATTGAGSKSAAKKSAAKKNPAKKTPPTTSTATKAAASPNAAKKTAAKKSASRKSASKKAAAKKATSASTRRSTR